MLIAIARIIADEPTSALDVTVQRRILDLIDTLRRKHGTAAPLVTHDLAVAPDRADRIVTLKSGRRQEAGPTRALLAAPQSAYTQQLLAAALALAAPLALRPREGGAEIVRAERLAQDFATRGAPPFRAVDGMSFSVAQGTTLGIAGESGQARPPPCAPSSR